MNDIDLMVNKLRAVAAQASGSAPANAAPSQDFAALLQSAVDEVNNTQLDAANSPASSRRQFEVNLQDVVLPSRKPASPSRPWFRCATSWSVRIRKS